MQSEDWNKLVKIAEECLVSRSNPDGSVAQDSVDWAKFIEIIKKESKKTADAEKEIRDRGFIHNTKVPTLG